MLARLTCELQPISRVGLKTDKTNAFKPPLVSQLFRAVGPSFD